MQFSETGLTHKKKQKIRNTLTSADATTMTLVLLIIFRKGKTTVLFCDVSLNMLCNLRTRMILIL